VYSPKSFNIDIAAIKNRYKALQRDLHPDKFAIKSEVS